MKNSLSFVNFIYLSKEELLEILKHRNAPEIRKQMVHSEIISEQEHFKFCENLRTNNHLFYYAVFFNEQLIGVVDYVLLDEKERTYTPGCYFFDEPSIVRTHAIFAASYILEKKCLLYPKIIVRKENIQALLFNTMKMKRDIEHEDDNFYYLCEKKIVGDPKAYAENYKKRMKKLSELYLLKFKL